MGGLGSPYPGAPRRAILCQGRYAAMPGPATEDTAMPIQKMDHFTILTKDWRATAEFYEDILGFKAGERPNFAFPGCWLHNDGKPILHVIERPEIPQETGLLDHMAFSATGLAGYVSKLKARNIKYDLRRGPEGGEPAGGGGGVFPYPKKAQGGARVVQEEGGPPPTPRRRARG